MVRAHRSPSPQATVASRYKLTIHKWVSAQGSHIVIQFPRIAAGCTYSTIAKGMLSLPFTFMHGDHCRTHTQETSYFSHLFKWASNWPTHLFWRPSTPVPEGCLDKSRVNKHARAHVHLQSLSGAGPLRMGLLLRQKCRP